MPHLKSPSKKTKKTWAKHAARPTLRGSTGTTRDQEKPELSDDAAEEIDTDDEMLREGEISL